MYNQVSLLTKWRKLFGSLATLRMEKLWRPKLANYVLRTGEPFQLKYMYVYVWLVQIIVQIW